MGDGIAVISYTPATHTFVQLGEIAGSATGLAQVDPISLAVDESGNIYVAVANSVESGGFIYEYPAGSGSSGTQNVAPIRTITTTVVPEIWAANGLVYADGQHDFAYTTQVYSTASDTMPVLTIAQPTNIGVADVIADHAGNIYVSNIGNVFQTITNGSTLIDVYSNTGTLLNTITQGVNQVESMAFDASGNLYANNYFKTITPPVCCQLNEYAAANLLTNPAPIMPLTTGQAGPGSAIAIDASGNLFATPGNLEVFAAGYGPTSTPTATLSGLGPSTFSLGLYQPGVTPNGAKRRRR